MVDYPQKIICLVKPCVNNQYPFCSKKEITIGDFKNMPICKDYKERSGTGGK